MKYETETERTIILALLDIRDIKDRLAKLEDELMHEITIRPIYEVKNE